MVRFGRYEVRLYPHTLVSEWYLVVTGSQPEVYVLSFRKICSISMRCDWRSVGSGVGEPWAGDSGAAVTTSNSLSTLVRTVAAELATAATAVNSGEAGRTHRWTETLSWSEMSSLQTVSAANKTLNSLSGTVALELPKTLNDRQTQQWTNTLNWSEVSSNWSETWLNKTLSSLSGTVVYELPRTLNDNQTQRLTDTANWSEMSSQNWSETWTSLLSSDTASPPPLLRHSHLVYTLLTCVVLGAIILAAIVGNAFVIAAIVLERNLQSVANYLIASLAVADLLVAALVMPLAAVNEISSRWFFGSAACDAFVSFDVLCCTASILHLVAISVDRYWAVTRVDYIHNRPVRRIFAMIALSWAISTVISIPPLFGWKTPDNDPDVTGLCLISQVNLCVL